YPVTDLGRGVAVGLMLCGIAILGTVTATLASWIVERVSDTNESTSALAAEIKGLREEVAEVRELLQTAPNRSASQPNESVGNTDGEDHYSDQHRLNRQCRDQHQAPDRPEDLQGSREPALIVGLGER